MTPKKGLISNITTRVKARLSKKWAAKLCLRLFRRAHSYLPRYAIYKAANRGELPHTHNLLGLIYAHTDFMGSV